MSYDPTIWTTGQKVTATKMNKLEQGVANAGGYDIVIEVSAPFDNISAFSVTEGSILACEQKVSNHEPVNGVLIMHSEYSAVPSDANSAKMDDIFTLVSWLCPYRTIYFGRTTVSGGTTVGVSVYSLQYNASTGALTSYTNAYSWI